MIIMYHYCAIKLLIMCKKLDIDKAKAYRYYCKGLTSKEISKLLDCSFRTIQNYMSDENWKNKRETSKMTKASKK
jgi:uncharacterized protein YjcR